MRERPPTASGGMNFEEGEQYTRTRKHGILKLNSVSLSSACPKSELLRFSSAVSTTNGKIRSAYTLFDSGASHGFVDSNFARSLGLVLRSSGTMVVTTAGQSSEVIERQQVYLKAALRGTTGNRIQVDGWYTLFDLKGNYDLIIGKDWMSANPHTVDHSTNTLHLLKGDWSTLVEGCPILIPGKSIVGLRTQ